MAQKLNQLSNMPQLAAVFANWTSRITLTKRTQTISAGLVSYTDSDMNFRGIIQPLSPEAIALKPEGQRSWKWLQIHCQNCTLPLTTDDQIVYLGEIYKIMAVLDYGQNGFQEFHCVKEFQ